MSTKKWMAALLLASNAAGASASEDTQTAFWQVQTSAYTRHFSADSDHQNHQKLLGLEYNRASGWLYGGALFRNSFDQPSQYAYAGMRWENDRWPVYAKLSAGLIHGYKGDYKNKIPLNQLGIAPVIIPTIGAHWGPVTTEMLLLGNSAVMLNVGLRIY